MTGTSLTIVVEGQSDVDLIRTILGKELSSQVRFFAGQGKMSLASLGRNILVHEGGPILVVKDADTTNQQLIDEQRGFTRLALSRVATPGDFDVFLFVPTIEIVYFEAPAALRHLLGRDIPPETLREGAVLPKATLAALPRGKAAGPLNGKHIDSDLGELLATGKQATAFKEAVQRLLVQHAEA